MENIFYELTKFCKDNGYDKVTVATNMADKKYEIRIVRGDFTSVMELDIIDLPISSILDIAKWKFQQNLVGQECTRRLKVGDRVQVVQLTRADILDTNILRGDLGIITEESSGDKVYSLGAFTVKFDKMLFIRESSNARPNNSYRMFRHQLRKIEEEK